MPSLQRFKSRGHSYYRIVESFRRADGKPAIRTLEHLGKADDLLARLRGERGALRVRSVSAGAVEAAFRLTQQLGVAELIDQAIAEAGGAAQTRDGLGVGQSLTIAAICRLCHPSSKRAIADWVRQTSLPSLAGFEAATLTSQHFWDQMDAMPVGAVSDAEQRIVQRALTSEALSPGLIAYDTTNFHTYIATTNTRSALAQRGHNKQRRHDLRQLGLALIVSEDGQIPLAHTLYEGSRSDVRSFSELLKPLRSRLRRLIRQASQLTFVFDQGAESKANLGALMGSQEHFVTALKPSHHRAWLSEVSGQLTPVLLSTNEQVQALRSQRLVHGVQQTVVVIRSEKLLQGQLRGLEQATSAALRQISKLSGAPRGGAAGARQRIARIVNRQYLRRILRCEVIEENGRVVYQPRIDSTAREQLTTQYFGLRILATNRHDWKTEQIIEAYRGQSRVERAFQDLKDPWVAAFRPQHHWTDHKLIVHAFIAMLALLIGRILLRRAQIRVGFRGTLRTLIQRLADLRCATLIELHSDRGGRPRARTVYEDCDASLQSLARALEVRLA